MKRKEGFRRFLSAAFGVIVGAAVAFFKTASGAQNGVAAVDGISVAGMALLLPWALSFCASLEGSDGLFFAAKQAFFGVIPFGKRQETFQDCKRKRKEKRKKEIDAFPAWVGGTLCVTALLLAGIIG